MDEPRHASTGHEPASPRVIAGRYRLCQVLGQGGNGQVWVADDLVLGEQVALKLLRRADAAALARVRREIAALRLLRLPGVVRLLDEGVDGDTPFLVMERLRGEPFPGARPGARMLLQDASHAGDRGDQSSDQPAADTAADTEAGSTADSDGVPAAAPPRRPAVRPVWRWSELTACATALLEILARVHAAGIVHRDLKPANILVSADGRPTVLDFGLSYGRSLGEHLTETGTTLGTPAYLAPEQVHDSEVDARADLYAVGTMLYEALTGRLPYQASSLDAMLYARLVQAPPPVADLAPEVPAPIAALIDALLALAPEARPGSAAEVLAVLHGESDARGQPPLLPRLGGDGPVRAVRDAARAGRSIDITGAAGSGRSRCLHDAAAQLEAAGRRVLWTRPSQRPFASLQALNGTLEAHAAGSIDAVTADVERGLREALAAGTVLMADDAERLDRWSHAALRRCRDAGTVVRVLPAALPGEAENTPADAIRLAPLAQADLQALFAGPDRLFHLAEDAARLLWQRTEGVPRRVNEEMNAWMRAGLAHQDGARWTMSREAIERLEAGPPQVPLLRHTALMDAPHLDALLDWLALAGGCAAGSVSVSALAALAGEPVWRVDAELDELVRRGAARRLADGRVEPLGHTGRLWQRASRQAAHMDIARILLSSSGQRLFHLLAGDAPAPAIADEAIALARDQAARGQLGAAAATLGEALLAVRRRANHDGPEEPRLVTEAAKVALHEGTPRALDRVLYELCRMRPGSEAVREAAGRLEALLRAAVAVHGVSAARAADLVRGLQPFAEPELERWRHWVQVRAAVRTGPADFEAAVAALGAWADACGDSEARAVHAWATGMLRYSQGRFEEAAHAYAEAARHEAWHTARISAMVNRASALMEAFLLDEAARMAGEARRLAADSRHAHFEARAEWIARAADYRRGRCTAPDLELVEVIAGIGEPNLEALVCLNEAAVAFGAGVAEQAADLAGRAADIWKRMGRVWGELLARSLGFAARGEIEPEARALVDSGGERDANGEAAGMEDLAAALGERAKECPIPGIGLQILGLLGVACPAARVRWQGAIEPLLESVAPRFRHLRMDVLSADEARAWADARPVQRGRSMW